MWTFLVDLATEVPVQAVNDFMATTELGEQFLKIFKLQGILRSINVIN